MGNHIAQVKEKIFDKGYYTLLFTIKQRNSCVKCLSGIKAFFNISKNKKTTQDLLKAILKCIIIPWQEGGQEIPWKIL